MNFTNIVNTSNVIFSKTHHFNLIVQKHEVGRTEVSKHACMVPEKIVKTSKFSQ